MPPPQPLLQSRKVPLDFYFVIVHDALTVPIAHRMLFRMIEAMWSINSMEVAHGSMQVVLMYLTGVSLLDCN